MAGEPASAAQPRGADAYSGGGRAFRADHRGYAAFGSPGALNGGLGAERIIALPLREARELFEREYLNAQIMRFGGNISRTATFIGMERSALHRKLKLLGMADDREDE